MKKETKKRIKDAIGSLADALGKGTDEVVKDTKDTLGDVHKKVTTALGMFTDDDMLNIIAFTRKELIKDRGTPNIEILKRYVNKRNKDSKAKQ